MINGNRKFQDWDDARSYERKLKWFHWHFTRPNPICSAPLGVDEKWKFKPYQRLLSILLLARYHIRASASVISQSVGDVIVGVKNKVNVLFVHKHIDKSHLRIWGCYAKTECGLHGNLSIILNEATHKTKLASYTGCLLGVIFSRTLLRIFRFKALWIFNEGDEFFCRLQYKGLHIHWHIKWLSYTRQKYK